MDQSNKKRCTNFSKDEVETLMDLVETHRHVIEYAELRSQVYKTGGGPLPDLNLTGLGKRVLNLVGVSAKGTECEFDSDAASVTPSELESTGTNVEGCSAEVEEIPIADSAEIKWDTWSPALLRQSKHPALMLMQCLQTIRQKL
ncbi:hypothetical protein HUJ05_006657 [Dendroctonus ponderosae]|nr:hypothetical protein HUJ05_006657 [Dendroctonus ponderosae]